MSVGMDAVWLAVALFGSAASGFWVSRALMSRIAQSERKRSLKGSASRSADCGKALLCGGLAAWVIRTALNQSLVAASSKLPDGRFAALRLSEDLMDRMRLAGMTGRISAQGAYQARVVCLITFGALFSVCGMMISVQLSVAGALAGMAFGWWSIRWALSCEARARKQSLESHLSEAVEVICLGLRSGLSFDYALQMYCDHFDTVLSRELSLARGEWVAGLKARDQALRDVASGYDSAIFLRVVESIVRAMRFGSPLADALESLAGEARQAHKADVEEKVMKAPVKMMLPVGTLILPSMLILVLGPVLLDLVSGF